MRPSTRTFWIAGYALALLAGAAVAPARAQSEESIFRSVRGLWASENSGGIAEYFDESVSIYLSGKGDRYGRGQATQFLRQYFGDVEVREIQIARNGIDGYRCVYDHEYEDRSGRHRNRIKISLAPTRDGLRITSISD